MRFHFGLSFSWRTLKKFLIPILLGLLAYFGFSGIYDNTALGIIQTYAQTNNDTSFIVNIPDYNTILNNIDCGSNGSMLDVVKDIIQDYDDTYFQLFVGAPSDNGDISFYIIRYPTVNWYNLAYFAYNSGTSQNPNNIIYMYAYYSNSSIRQPYYTLTANSCSNYQNSTGYTNFKYIVNNNLTSSSYPPEGDGLTTNNYTAPNNVWDTAYQIDSLDNDLSYISELWFYYSSHDLYFNQNYSSSSLNKKICLLDNDTCYSNSDYLPSYFDLYGFDILPSVPTFKKYQGSIETLYTNLSISDFSNYYLKVKFDIENVDDTTYFIDNTNFQYICSGRVDHTDYYTYDTFPCSLSNSYTITNSTIEYTFNNITTTQTLSNYDKFYVTIKSNYLDPSVSSIISDFSYSYNYGDFFNFKYDGAIFETYHNLPLNFKLYLSSNNDTPESIVDIFDYNLFNYGLNIVSTDNTNFTINGGGGIDHAQTWYNGQWEDLGYTSFVSSNLFNYGILIYQQDSAIPYPTLRLIFSSGMVVSFNNSNTNDFYIINSQGTISSNNVDIPIISKSNSYDISYYLHKVDTFINDLSSSNLTFAIYTQDFYDRMPLTIQTFIFVMFIIACVYIVFLLIKK